MIPTLEDFRADRTSRRWTYLSAIAVYHLRDHLAEALVTPTGDPKADRRAVEREAERVDAAVRAALPSPLPFDIVEGVANGSKHRLTRRRHAVPFAAGTDRQRWSGIMGETAFGLTAYGDGPAGREFLHEGRRLDIYGAVQAVFLAFVAAYPAHLGGCSFDPEARGPADS